MGCGRKKKSTGTLLCATGTQRVVDGAADSIVIVIHFMIIVSLYLSPFAIAYLHLNSFSISRKKRSG